MNWFEYMHKCYAPEMTLKQFSDHINSFETEFFNKNEEVLQLAEEEQNNLLEKAYREKCGVGI